MDFSGARSNSDRVFPVCKGKRNMSELDALLLDGLRAEMNLQYTRKAMREIHRQQLLEAERRQREDLEKRIHLNSLISTDRDRKVHNERQTDRAPSHRTSQIGNLDPRRSRSTSSLATGKGTSQQLRQLEKPISPSAAWISSTNVSQQTARASTAAQRGTQPLQQQALSNTQLAYVSKEAEAEAECRKKFHASPVPRHASLPLYHKLMQLREEERKQGHDQRKNFLLSIQKPFSFLERDKEKREKMIEMLSQTVQTQKATKAVVVSKTAPKIREDTEVSPLSKDKELCTEVQMQTRAQENVRKSIVLGDNYLHTSNPKLRCAERTKRELLAFLDEKPSFQPKINPGVPDFNRLHKALPIKAPREAERNDVTQCQPFHLRTSTLSTRQSRMTPKTSLEPRISHHLNSSSSFGGITSLSRDTLPTYITDAVRMRGIAIRKSMQLWDSEKQESADWVRKYRMRSQAMKKTIAIRAKVMDPHSSLKEVYHEKLQRHREADQQRMREYMRELRDMKARVTVRPLLFEQVKQESAKAHALHTYRNKLKEAGLNELFVEAHGEGVEVTAIQSGSEDDTDTSYPDIENEIQISPLVFSPMVHLQEELWLVTASAKR
ncbi:protein FAM161B [Lampris incognitus]|uniref:protein FAM161B n=1 Tax=Lampris incognitus TaxID=2546036 RepID=UPI0024B525C1|nr:protein FAM161B [Lampris incognitus]